MFGRSNVGKSSLINTLLGRHGVARISKTPGKTRSANFFLVNDRFLLVDMPGYGYAKVARSEQQRFAKVFTQYLDDDTRRNALVQLVDARHDPTDADIESVDRMSATGRPLCIVFNKADKLKRAALERSIRTALNRFDTRPDVAVIPFSSVTGTGKRELWAWIRATLSL